MKPAGGVGGGAANQRVQPTPLPLPVSGRFWLCDVARIEDDQRKPCFGGTCITVMMVLN